MIVYLFIFVQRFRVVICISVVRQLNTSFEYYLIIWYKFCMKWNVYKIMKNRYNRDEKKTRRYEACRVSYRIKLMSNKYLVLHCYVVCNKNIDYISQNINWIIFYRNNAILNNTSNMWASVNFNSFPGALRSITLVIEI